MKRREMRQRGKVRGRETKSVQEIKGYENQEAIMSKAALTYLLNVRSLTEE